MCIAIYTVFFFFSESKSKKCLGAAAVKTQGSRVLKTDVHMSWQSFIGCYSEVDGQPSEMIFSRVEFCESYCIVQYST